MVVGHKASEPASNFSGALELIDLGKQALLLGCRAPLLHVLYLSHRLNLLGKALDVCLLLIKNSLSLLSKYNVAPSSNVN